MDALEAITQELAHLRQQVNDLKAGATTYVQGVVSAINTANSTFSVEVGGQVDGTTLSLAGVSAPNTLLPAVGDIVTLAVAGAQPNFQSTGGPPGAAYTQLQSSGLHVYQTTLGGQGLSQQGLAGATSGNFWSTVDGSGNLIYSADPTGQVNAQAMNLVNDPSVNGYNLSALLNAASGAGNGSNSYTDNGAQHYYGYNYSMNTGVSSVIVAPAVEKGLVEQSVYVSADRMYWIAPEVSWHVDTANPTELQLKVFDGGTGTPAMSGTPIWVRYFHAPIVAWDEVSHSMGLWTPSYTGVHNLLLAAGNSPSSAGNLSINGVNCAPTLNVIDAGPNKGINASPNDGSGVAPPPIQQYYTEISPSGYWRYTGAGALRTDTTDVIQGWDPYNGTGDNQGHWAFPMPTITGTINRIDLYLYNNWAYYNSGGSAILNVASTYGVYNPTKLQTDWNPGVTYPKPGVVAVTLPSSWYSSFAGTGITRAITLGPSGGSNESYYIRGAASSARLRVWYTQ